MPATLLLALLAILMSVVALRSPLGRVVRRRALTALVPTGSVTTLAAFAAWAAYGTAIGSALVVATATLALFIATVALSLRCLFAAPR